jgi:hypothetical protein
MTWLDPQFARLVHHRERKRDPDQLQQKSPDEKKLMNYPRTAGPSVPGVDCWLL